jgi:Skp family chaperone for outer membrane proteins
MAEGQKIACFNMQKVFMDSIQGKAFRSTMETLKKDKEKELEKINDSIKNLEDQMKAPQSPAKKDSSKKDVEERLNKAYMERERFFKEANDEMKRKQDSIVKPFEADIDKIVNEYGKKNSIDLIFDVSAGSIVYSSDSVDITKIILETFDKMTLDRQPSENKPASPADSGTKKDATKKK